MKLNKLHLTLLFGFGLFTAPVFADTYEGNVSGIGCGKCKAAIQKAFSGVEGITTIRFVDPAKEGELHKIVVETKDGVEISNEKAVETLKDSNFSIKKWDKKEA